MRIFIVAAIAAPALAFAPVNKAPMRSQQIVMMKAESNEGHNVALSVAKKAGMMLPLVLTPFWTVPAEQSVAADSANTRTKDDAIGSGNYEYKGGWLGGDPVGTGIDSFKGQERGTGGVPPLDGKFGTNAKGPDKDAVQASRESNARAAASRGEVEQNQQNTRERFGPAAQKLKENIVGFSTEDLQVPVAFTGTSSLMAKGRGSAGGFSEWLGGANERVEAPVDQYAFKANSPNPTQEGGNRVAPLQSAQGEGFQTPEFTTKWDDFRGNKERVPGAAQNSIGTAVTGNQNDNKFKNGADQSAQTRTDNTVFQKGYDAGNAFQDATKIGGLPEKPSLFGFGGGKQGETASAQSVKGKASEAADRIKDTADSKAGGILGKASDAADSILNKAQQATSGDVASKARETADSVRGKASEAADKIKGAADRADGKVKSATSATTNFQSKVSDDRPILSKEGISTGDKVKGAFEEAGDRVKQALNGPFEGNPVLGTLNEATDDIKGDNKISSKINDVASSVNSKVEQGKSAAGNTGAFNLGGLGGKANEDARQAVQGNTEALQNKVKQAGEQVKGAVGSANTVGFNFGGNQGGNVGGNFGEKVTEAASSSGAKVGSIGDKVKDVASNQGGNVGDKINDAASRAGEGVKSKIGDGTPVLDQVSNLNKGGEFFEQGGISGKAREDVGQAAQGDTDALGNKAKQAGDAIKSSLITGFGDIGDKAREDATQAVKGNTDALGNKVKQAGEQAKSAVGGGNTGGFSLGGLGDKVKEDLSEVGRGDTASLGNKVQQAGEQAKSAVGGNTGGFNFGGLGGKAKEDATQAVKGKTDALGNKVKQAGEQAKSAVGGGNTGFFGLGGKAKEDATDVVKGNTGALGNKVKQAGEQAKSAVGGGNSGFFGLGGKAKEDVSETVRGDTDSLGAKVKQATSGAFGGIGGNAGGDGTQAIRGDAQAIGDKVKETANRGLGSFGGGDRADVDQFGEQVKGTRDAINDKLPSTGGFFGNLGGNSGLAGKAKEDVSETIRGDGNALGNKVKQATDVAKGKVGDNLGGKGIEDVSEFVRRDGGALGDKAREARDNVKSSLSDLGRNVEKGAQDSVKGNY